MVSIVPRLLTQLTFIVLQETNAGVGMARNDALGSGHTTINSNSQSYFIYVTEKLTVNQCFWSYTQLQTAPALKLFEDHGRAHAHYAKICT